MIYDHYDSTAPVAQGLLNLLVNDEKKLSLLQGRGYAALRIIVIPSEEIGQSDIKLCIGVIPKHYTSKGQGIGEHDFRGAGCASPRMRLPQNISLHDIIEQEASSMGEIGRNFYLLIGTEIYKIPEQPAEF